MFAPDRQRLLALVPLLLATVALGQHGPSKPAATGEKPGLPPDINGLISLNVAEAWSHEAMSPVRKARGKLEFAWMVQSLIGLTPAQIDRLTMLWSASAPKALFVLVQSRKPVEPAEVAKTLSRPGAEQPKPAGGTVATAPGADFAFVIPVDDRTYLLAHRSADPARAEKLAAALAALRSSDSTLVVSLDEKALAQFPLPLDKGLRTAKNLRLTADLGEKTALVKLTAAFDDAVARGAGPALRSRFNELAAWAAAEGKKAEERVGARNSYAAPLYELLTTTLKAAKVRTEKNSIIATAEVKLDDFASALLMAAPDAVLSEGGSTIAANNMKQIVLAFHNYADANGACVSNSYDKDGKPLLSWRVHLLPYIEQDNLYKQFKLDEPWDSPHNKPLGETVVKVFQVPGHPASKPWMTYFRGFIGTKSTKPEHQPWLLEGRSKGPQFPSNFPDGTSNTLLVAETAEAVPWSKPDDLVYDGVMALPKLGGPNGSFVVGFADGSVSTFRRGQLNEMTLRALITTQGGEVVNIPGR